MQNYGLLKFEMSKTLDGTGLDPPTSHTSVQCLTTRPQCPALHYSNVELNISVNLNSILYIADLYGK